MGEAFAMCVYQIKVAKSSLIEMRSLDFSSWFGEVWKAGCGLAFACLLVAGCCLHCEDC